MGSYAQTIMKDQRLTLQEAQVVTAPESTLEFTQAYPGAVAVGRAATVGDIVFQEYTPEVQKTVGQLIESVELVHTETIPTLLESFNLVTKGLVESFGDVITETAGTFGQSIEAISEASGRAAETSMKVTEVLGEKLHETQVGTASILPGVAKYMLIAAVVIIIAGKVWK